MVSLILGGGVTGKRQQGFCYAAQLQWGSERTSSPDHPQSHRPIGRSAHQEPIEEDDDDQDHGLREGILEC